MNKFILLFAVITFTCLSANAQTINTVIKGIPDEILVGLEPMMKDELVATGADSLVLVQTDIYSGIKRLKFTPDYIVLQTSDSATLQIKLLPLVNDSKIICVINTVCGKACDSHLNFYTPSWKPISKSELFPKIDINWFIKGDTDRTSQDFENAYTVLDINPVKLTLSDVNNNISAILDIRHYLSKEDYKNIEPFLTNAPKTLVWDKVMYK